MTIVEFLEARWDEEEQVARSAGGDVHLTVPAYRFIDDIAAKRAILAQWTAAEQMAAAYALNRVVRSLASIYRDHPDYPQEWAIG